MLRISSLTDVERYLSGVIYPTRREELSNYARSRNASDEVVEVLIGLPAREYKNTADVLSELELE